MRKLFALGFIIFTVASIDAMAFSDIGTSRSSCAAAKNEAEVIARGHCLSLDTTPNIRRFGKCQRKKYNGKREYRVSVIYRCQIDTKGFDQY